MKKINEWMAKNIPVETYEVCTIEDIIGHLIFHQSDTETITTRAEALPTIEKIGKKEKERLPGFSDAVDAFDETLQKMIARNDVAPTTAIVSIQSKWSFSFNELLIFQALLNERFSFTPLILMGYIGDKKIDISCIMGNGKKRECQGCRLAFDLDDTITRWPSFFSMLSESNCDSDSYNLIVSTRYEPVTSSCHQAVYNRELAEIKKLHVKYDKLVHAWWPFELAEKLFPCGGELDWLKCFIWHKVFYCRLHHIDIFYEDQQRNIELFRKYAPDIEVVHVQQNHEPSEAIKVME